MTRRMHLVGYLVAGPTWHHNGSWRMEGSDAAEALSAGRYERLARIMEAACFDGLFFVDNLALMEFFGGSSDAVLTHGGQIYMLEPMQLLATIARATRHIGLSATMSTAFYHPFHIARAFATLDHISAGRAGWNVVTSTLTCEAQNFGRERLLPPDQRYDHADEVIAACDALWQSWEADAILFDREGGRYADPTKVHRADFQGRWVRSRGPLPTPRMPQERPVIMQAGASPRGRDFAARWAEIVFTLQHSKPDMQAFYADVKGRLAANGRAPESCTILPAVDVVLGETETIARERAAHLKAMVNAEFGIAEMSNATGIDLSRHAPQSKVADLALAEGARGMLDVIRQASVPETTLIEAARSYGNTRMNPQLVGTAVSIADQLEDYFTADCCDGFVICPAISPQGYIDVCRCLVPELQRRGLFRSTYTGRTFRDHLHDG